MNFASFSWLTEVALCQGAEWKSQRKRSNSLFKVCQLVAHLLYWVSEAKVNLLAINPLKSKGKLLITRVSFGLTTTTLWHKSFLRSVTSKLILAAQTSLTLLRKSLILISETKSEECSSWLMERSTTRTKWLLKHVNTAKQHEYIHLVSVTVATENLSSRQQLLVEARIVLRLTTVQTFLDRLFKPWKRQPNPV